MILLTQNSKLKKTSKTEGKRVYNFGIPAFNSKDGFKTCPNAGACAVGCYAQAGAYRFRNVAQAFEKRLAITLTDSFVPLVKAELIKKRVDVLRIHDSGDFYDYAYTMKWFKVMLDLPDIQFYAYSKNVSFFKGLLLPDNFTVIYSYGGLEDKLINMHTDRHSRVFETLAELIEAGYANTSDNDLIAIGKNPKIGLVYHGTKSFKNTNWKYQELTIKNPMVGKPGLKLVSNGEM